jgi:hypothetical protein
MEEHHTIASLLLETLLYNVADQTMTKGKRNLFECTIFSSLLFIGMTVAMLWTPTTPAMAQNMSNLTTSTGIDDVGLVTITPQQINENKNNINVIRQALEQGNIPEALSNLSTVEEQLSLLTEET